MADARLFQALSDPTRLKIMSLLARGPMNVSSMVARLGCAQPAVSRHLRVLRDVALIRDKRKGKEVEYCVNLEQLGDAAGYLGDLVAAAETAPAEVPAAAVKPAVRRSGVEGRAEPEASDTVVGWAQQPRPRPAATVEAGAEAQSKAASRGGVRTRVTARAEGRPRAGAGAGTRRAAASGKRAKPAKAGRAGRKPEPKSKPKRKSKPKPTSEPEYVIEREDDTMDDFLL